MPIARSRGSGGMVPGGRHYTPPILYLPWKGHGTRDTLPPSRRNTGPEIPYPPCEQIDRHLWKHYLPATTVAGGRDEWQLGSHIMAHSFLCRKCYCTNQALVCLRNKLFSTITSETWSSMWHQSWLTFSQKQNELRHAGQQSLFVFLLYLYIWKWTDTE